MHKIIKINTEKQFTDITPQVSEFVKEKGTGIVQVFSRHTTLSVRVFEAEILLLADVGHFLEKIAPINGVYNHDNIWIRDVPKEERINGYSHIRSLLFNTIESIPVENGKLLLGKWQTIFAIELDPIRDRELVLTFIKSN